MVFSKLSIYQYFNAYSKSNSKSKIQWTVSVLTFDLKLSSNMSAAQLSFLDLIMKSASPLLGGFILALGKEADFLENPKWRTNSL